MDEPGRGASRRSGLRAAHVAATLLALAAVGLSTFTTLAWRAVRLESADGVAARQQFEGVRARFQGARPRLARDATGRWMRVARREAARGTAETLVVLAYRAGVRQLVRAVVPLWFLELKGPALRLSVRRTGLDLNSLGLRAEELKREGPTLLVDDGSPDGNWLLVWTE